ncbi:CENPX protein, partial [Dromaius novaehollandiae]|nr:CENPX protein [Dromaius novaehollandiae]
PTLVLSLQETVDRLLRLHFRDGRTRVNGDALLLTAELLKVFVRGSRTLLSRGVASSPQALTPPHHSPLACVPEAAARAARQARAEDLERVDIEHVEKVLPQLVCKT